MDISSIAGASQLMQSSQTQQALSTAMVKQAAEAQNKMADLLAQSAKQAPQPVKSPDYGFSTFA